MVAQETLNNKVEMVDPEVVMLIIQVVQDKEQQIKVIMEREPAVLIMEQVEVVQARWDKLPQVMEELV